MARGSIRKYTARDGTVTYRVRVDDGMNPATGRRRQVQCTRRTRREADQQLRAWLTDIDRGTFQRPQPQTMRELFLLWLETRIASGHKSTTYDLYETHVRVHLIPALGSIPVQQVTALHVEQFYALLVTRGASDHLIRCCKVRLAQALDVAIAHGIVAWAPRYSCSGWVCSVPYQAIAVPLAHQR